MVDRISGTNYTWLDGPMTKRGWIAKNKATGIAGTQFTPAFMNGVQEEVITLIESAGIVPSDADWTQVAKALQVMPMSWAGTATGTAAAMIATLSPVPPALKDGLTIRVKAAYACTGATTFWLNGIGAALPVVHRSGASPVSGEWAVGDNLVLQYNATTTKWVLQNPVVYIGPYWAQDTGTANAIVATISSPAITGLERGRTYQITLANNITGASTANLSGPAGSFGVQNVVRADGSPTQSGDGFAGEILPLVWTGTQLQISGLGGGSGAYVGIYYTTTSGAFSSAVPAGANRAEVEVWGAGGPTLYSSSGGAICGAGGGGYSKKYSYAVTPGGTVTGSIGAGPVGGTAANGGTTTCAGMTANGGGWGTPTSIGQGGTASGGDINLTGESGTPISSTGGSGGKGGSAPYGGQGGSTSNSGSTVQNGNAPGGGAGGPAGTGVYTGGSGANGGVRIIYYRS